MIGKSQAASAVARLGSIVGRSLDDHAQAEAVRRLMAIDADIDLDALVTDLVLSGKRYEAALREFWARVDRAKREVAVAAREVPAPTDVPQRSDAEVAAAMRNDADMYRRQGRPLWLAEVAERRAQFLAVGEGPAKPAEAATAAAGGKTCHESFDMRNATESA